VANSKRILAGLGLIWALASPVARAETTVAIMNYQAVLFNSSAAEAATLILRADLAGAQSRLQDIQLGIETRESRLMTDGDILTAEEISVFELELQGLAQEQAQITAQMQQAQQQSRASFIQQYQPLIRELMNAYVIEQGFSLVVDSQAVLWVNGTPDITDAMLTQFNSAYAQRKAGSAEQSAN
jgi:outer membrane protein